MKIKKIDRYSHTGKSNYEKETYRNFLFSKSNLDKTEEDSVNTNKTSESSFEEEKEKAEKFEPQKKSKWLRIKDFLYDNWIIALISGVILLIINGYITTYREQGIQGQKISTIEKSIDEIKGNNKENENNYFLLKESFYIFKTAASKDLEFIKRKLGF